MDARWSLRGKRAVVTGGTKGIGRATADTLLDLSDRFKQSRALESRPRTSCESLCTGVQHRRYSDRIGTKVAADHCLSRHTLRLAGLQLSQPLHQ